ncbi:MAG: DUF3341 domain-containing protein [Acidobacteriota bacterium]
MRAAQTYGLVAEFPSAEGLVIAARAARQAGYSRMEAYTPFPVEDLHDALDLPPSKVPMIVLAGGITGCLGGFGLAYWASAIAYPMNIGGKALNSWPAFIVPTFECTILVASLSAVLGMLALNGLPQPYHPLFNVERFSHASQDGYFLAIEARDKKFDPAATKAFLQGLNPSEVTEVGY